MVGHRAVSLRLLTSKQPIGSFAHGLEPRALAEAGLAAAIANLPLQPGTGLQVTLSADRLPRPIETTVYYVCSEAISNIAKHASASQVHVAITCDDESVLAMIEDDGVGGADASRGPGLRGLVEHVEAAGGHLAIESPKGGGTTLIATIPF